MEASEWAAEEAAADPTESRTAPRTARPTSAMIVTLVGGVLLSIAALGALNSDLNAPSWMPYSFLGQSGTPLLALLFAGLVAGGLVVMFAFFLYAVPEWHYILGGAILALSLASLFLIPMSLSTGGAVLGIVGGALGIGFR